MNIKTAASKIFSFFQNNLIATIVGGVIVTAITTWKIISFDYLSSLANNANTYLVGKVEVSRYTIYGILVACLFFAAGFFVFVVLKIKANLKLNPLEKCTSLWVGGILWRWNNYCFESVYNIRPFCPKCDLELRLRNLGYSSVLECPICGVTYLDVKDGYSSVLSAVEKLIQREHRKIMQGGN